MTEKQFPIVEYLGDGLYAVINFMGQIELRANDHVTPTDVVYLEPEVLESFLMFLRKHKLIE